MPDRVDPSPSDKLAALGAEALRGPWTWEAVGDHGYPQRIMANDDGYTLVAELFWGDPDAPNPDLELIVSLRNALPEIEALVRAAEEIDFVFAKGPIETTCHRNDFRGLTEALDALNRKLADA